MDDDATTQQHHAITEPDPAQRPARLALYLGVALLLAGAVIMYLGYDGTAKNAVQVAQTPYLISGGLAGLAMMVLGGISIAVSVILQVQADFRTEQAAMRESVERLAESMASRVFSSSPASTNGHAIVMVARGASSFHRQDCRLVQRAEHVKPLEREAADVEGLTPCRICKP